MAEPGGLSIAFAETHPAEAARVLEALTPEATAEFVSTVPTVLAASVLRHVGPPYCARVLARFDDTHIARLIQAMGPQVAARVLQQFSPNQQQQVLGHIPVTTSIAIRLLVGYPRGTCGAAA